MSLPGPKHSPKVKYFDIAVIVMVLQGQYTLPKERKVYKDKGLV